MNMTFPLKFVENPFLADLNVPEGTIYFIPRIERTLVFLEQTGEVKEYWSWSPKAAAIMTKLEIPKPERE